jgi:hypothetical protein
MEPGDKYWQSWEKLIEASSNLQGLFPHAVLVGGSAAAVHAQHRFSFDADHVLSDLEENYAEVVDFLEKRDDWKTARLNPPKLVLGNFQGVETGIRQLRRKLPLETELVTVGGRQLTVPTLPEMLRTKGWMIISRNAARDYIDFAALVYKAGMAPSAAALKTFDDYYSDIIRKNEVSPLLQLVRQLAAPRPHDLDGIDVSLYKGLSQPLNSWDYIKSICEKLSVELGEELSEDR